MWGVSSVGPGLTELSLGSQAVGLQAFLSGSDPVVMGNAVEALRAEK